MEITEEYIYNLQPESVEHGKRLNGTPFAEVIKLAMEMHRQGKGSDGWFLEKTLLLHQLEIKRLESLVGAVSNVAVVVDEHRRKRLSDYYVWFNSESWQIDDDENKQLIAEFSSRLSDTQVKEFCISAGLNTINFD